MRAYCTIPLTNPLPPMQYLLGQFDNGLQQGNIELQQKWRERDLTPFLLLYLHPIFGAPLGHQRPRGSVIVITDKGLLTTMTPLGNMVGNMWYNNSCDACHTHIMHTSGVSSTISIVSLYQYLRQLDRGVCLVNPP